MADSWWINASREELCHRATKHKFKPVRLASEYRGLPAEFRFEEEQDRLRRGRERLKALRDVGFDIPKVNLLADHGPTLPAVPAIERRAASLALVRDAINLRYRLGLFQLWIRFVDARRNGGLGEKLAAAEELMPVLSQIRSLLSEYEWSELESFINSHSDRLPPSNR